MEASDTPMFLVRGNIHFLKACHGGRRPASGVSVQLESETGPGLEVSCCVRGAEGHVVLLLRMYSHSGKTEGC